MTSFKYQSHCSHHCIPTQDKCYFQCRSTVILHGLQLVYHVNTDSDFTISLLIGAGTLCMTISSEGVVQLLPASRLGYFLSRPVSQTQSLNVVMNSVHVSTQDNEPYYTQKFSDLETTGTTVENNSNNHFLQEYSQHSITHLPNGSYCAKFLSKESHPQLPNNSAICKKRAHSLTLCLSQTLGLLQMYTNIISEQLNRGFIERVYRV